VTRQMSKSSQSQALSSKKPLRIALVVPHIFMQQDILPHVIFSPGTLALDLAEGLQAAGVQVSLFSPGPVSTTVENVTADLSYFQSELTRRGDGYIELLKKHPLTFISLARQVQAELIATAFSMANEGHFDLVHIYTNEEDIALPFAEFCTEPVVFTHHDPFNFLVTYKNVFPKYTHLNWTSISLAQRSGMPKDTNWVGNVSHGVSPEVFHPSYANGEYVAYIGRIIEPKGLHLAIAAVRQYNATHKTAVALKIAGKHYAGHRKDGYWQRYVEPEIDGHEIEYVGFLNGPSKATFVANASALMVPSIFDEPFGMTAIEGLASATPVICLDSGALPEIVQDGITGFVVNKVYASAHELDASGTAKQLADALTHIADIDRHACRAAFEARFTVERMCKGYLKIYESLIR
jgi:glycosyltransferase involved in cell wall biosynthesis